MPLPAPRLDDRSFQDIVNDTKRLIPRYCPEWTDHNVSDPGVTLIELFAYMVDLMLYRLNRVPQRNYIKWLEMLGIELQAPKPARTDVTFYLTGPQSEEVVIPSGTEVGTARTESQNSVTFSTDHDLTIHVPTMFQLLVSRDGRSYHDYMPAISNPSLNVGVFQDPPQPNDSLYFGYHEELRGHILRLTLDSQIEGIGVDPKDPPIIWEYWDGNSEEWMAMYLESDSTGGMNKAGEVVVHVPFAAKARDIDGRVAFWIRCRAIAARPNQAAYTAAPRLRSVETESLGGIVPASQVERIFRELLGRSDGKAGQEWPVSYPPVIERRPEERLEVEEEDGSFTPWQEVDDFADSGPNDLHYTMDNISGVLRFGPTLRDAGGRELQYGAIPQAGRQLRFSRYRTGGGTGGNVGANSITVLKSAVPFVARVTNGSPAIGGEDGESLEQALIRGPQVLRSRSRAVTKDDYEHLAREASPEVGRARCVAPTAEQLAAGKGVIKVLLVPASSHTDSIIPPAELKLNDRAIADVSRFIEQRRLITSMVALDAPEYRFVSVEVDVRPRKRVNKDHLQNAILGALYNLINPANGGTEGTGWPWEQDLFESEVTALVQRIEGVEYVEAVRLFVVNPADGARTAVKGIVQCPSNGLLASFRHLVVIK